MRTARYVVLVLVSLVVFGGCFHAVINTGIDAGPQKIEQKWAKGYVNGLVPPDAVEAGDECGAAGVARVETRRSFLNQLVSSLTFGIFSPMEIIVTCGGEGGEEGAASGREPEANESAAPDGDSPLDSPDTSKASSTPAGGTGPLGTLPSSGLRARSHPRRVARRGQRYPPPSHIALLLAFASAACGGKSDAQKLAEEACHAFYTLAIQIAAGQRGGEDNIPADVLEQLERDLQQCLRDAENVDDILGT